MTLSKIKTGKSRWRQVRSRSVYLMGDAVWGQECGPSLLQEVGPLFKVLLDVVSTGVILAAQRPKAQGLHERRSPR